MKRLILSDKICGLWSDVVVGGLCAVSALICTCKYTCRSLLDVCILCTLNVHRHDVPDCDDQNLFSLFRSSAVHRIRSVLWEFPVNVGPVSSSIDTKYSFGNPGFVGDNLAYYFGSTSCKTPL